MQAERGSDLAEPVKDALLATALRRAREIKNETGQEKTRVYACFLKHQRQEITYFLRRGFAHDEGMLILARDESSPCPPGGTARGHRNPTLEDGHRRGAAPVHRDA
jgi:hypothetical protein